MNDDEKIATFFEGIADQFIEVGKAFSFIKFCNQLHSRGFFRLLGMSIKPKTRPKLLEIVIPFFVQYAKNHGYVIIYITDITKNTDNTGRGGGRDISISEIKDITDLLVVFQKSKVKIISD